MKLFLKYLQQRRRIFIALLIFCTVFLLSFILYHLPLKAVIYPALLCALIGFLMLIFDFFKVRREHETLLRLKNISDAIVETLPPADSIKDGDYQRIIREMVHQHRLFCVENDHKYADMIDYYTVWAHQIKTPIASMRLRLQNEDSTFSRALISDLHRIEQYVEMVLTFLRLDSESTDYVFKEHDLDKIVKKSVRKFSSEFINRKLSLSYAPINMKVVTDDKWLSFVIEQLLSNALKYTPSGSIFVSLEFENTLRIRDTGIGIAPEDLPRIFENGYTGYNGRANKNATGIGLYLCQRICTNLGYSISIRSTIDVGTTVDLNLAQEKLEIE